MDFKLSDDQELIVQAYTRLHGERALGPVLPGVRRKA